MGSPATDLRVTPSRTRAAAAATLALGACTGWVDPPRPLPERPAAPLALPRGPARAPDIARCERIERIEVHKSERRLLAHCASGATLDFPIALSREPGPKSALGDRRTPEGAYRIAAPARDSRFHRFLPIDYPSVADADAAFGDGRISAVEREAIALAHREGRLPPQDTALGGHLGFHGEGERWRGDLDLDWTEGCFALTDDAIDTLAARAPPGTPVEILP